MKVRLKKADPSKVKADTLVLFLLSDKKRFDKQFQTVDKSTNGLLSNLMKKGALSGDAGKVNVVFNNGGNSGVFRIIVTGIGVEKKVTPDSLRNAAGRAIRQISSSKPVSVVFACPQLKSSYSDEDFGQAIVEGAILADYQFTDFKSSGQKETNGKIAELTLLYDGSGKLSKAVEKARIGALASCFTRDLCNTPCNSLTPTDLAKAAKKMARSNKLKCEILDETKMKALKMNALLAVSQGSAEPAKLLVLEHKPKSPKNKKPIVLVGKGITFDTGGISIKPGLDMHKMKYDMSGGGVVLGIMKAVSELALPLHVVGIVPAAENMPDGKAYKPGDVIKASNGTTIEIINTDAEGRMILADALVYAQKFKPGVIIDFATLTGACIIALGYATAAMVGNDQKTMDQLRRSAETSGERVWEMPLFQEHKDQIKSFTADIKNTGGRAAGTLTAAAFLRNFVGETPWVHLDIAGTSWSDQEKPYLAKGSTGFGVRLLVEMLSAWS